MFSDNPGTKVINMNSLAQNYITISTNYVILTFFLEARWRCQHFIIHQFMYKLCTVTLNTSVRIIPMIYQRLFKIVIDKMDNLEIMSGKQFFVFDLLL